MEIGANQMPAGNCPRRHDVKLTCLGNRFLGPNLPVESLMKVGNTLCMGYCVPK
jgi:hypothetical protein